ncbi:heterokaryon incompatibility protein-domain-containing protein [Annulohypoxylon moriforme]|nr:heterokaryon incompatibility protein-domain-containing protein [Annulohypoxylon moriforme]
MHSARESNLNSPYTTTSNDGSIYKPLDSSKREIRLLRMIDGPEDRPVKCSLHTVSLDDSTPFAALSYVWGDANITKEILVNGRFRKVPATLESAMRNFRDIATKSETVPKLREARNRTSGLVSKSDSEQNNVRSPDCVKRVAKDNERRGRHCHADEVRSTTQEDDEGNKKEDADAILHQTMLNTSIQVGDGRFYLWVDAICINQRDLREKGHQVHMMRDIYAQAGFVISWINPSNNRNTELALKTIREIAPRLGNKTGFEWMREYPELCSYDRHVPGSFYGNKYWDSIYDLQTSDYFKRVWIVQELWLCRIETAFFISKDEILPFCYLILYARWSVNSRESLQSDPRPLFMDDELWKVFRCDMPEFNCLGDYFSRLMMKNDPKSPDLNDSRCSSLRLNIFLRISQRCYCKDPRDKVFGLLGVFPMGIMPDYNRSIEDVFTDWATNPIWNIPPMVLVRLSGLGVRPRSKPNRALPSWVPDLEFFNDQNSGVADKAIGLETYSTLPTRFLPTVSRANGLSCFGVYHTEVSEIISKGHWKGLSGTEACHRIVKYLISNADILEGGSYPSGGSQLKAFIKTLLRIRPSFLRRDILTSMECASPDQIDGYSSRMLLISLIYVTLSSLTSETYWMYSQLVDFTLGGELYWDLYNLCIDNVDEISITDINVEYVPIYNIVLAMEYHTIFHTANGLIGAGPVGMEEGDKVYLVHGSPQPVMLREVEGKLMNVGICYVHGISDDESYKILKQRENEVQEINIV